MTPSGLCRIVSAVGGQNLTTGQKPGQQAIRSRTTCSIRFATSSTPTSSSIEMQSPSQRGTAVQPFARRKAASGSNERDELLQPWSIATGAGMRPPYGACSDGGPFHWFGPDRPVYSLIGTMDDATGVP